ncbi:LLM class flavin-dependent oxidoreductase [Geobacillus thermodenitrificans]|jgi:long-chain alkane monooxygenase|uniref:Long-chain alkane monooxygenase n=1 Tax=Geobacillus thermodenitrificans (strain NG80-2) TaxID=420246 RepID=LADA_GEOTN|nr:LLM class flavin-dependent oxidoreductase [Geobacillus thermodenitrificans]A4IU28.1 RecName: Full=Long-chain alkane monooxygenase; AltName: Full=Long-chain alkane degradation protein A [Geobacillus thermodenitrificans NG80-2]3B9N_A Chain A, Alkane monooxygenase [Geobacillus thermodenitrificans]3B9N_B Chain B, Alkane monooxygenase [Geobacillus thermodenitrificans]3B9O_A Chain A, Alkane monooxygenase [Geobacillus thermodenitrificans]3B9O_B Chain B, Alkane monooxygenase [Geobacillus thermodeni
MTKKIHINAFEMNCVGHIAHGLWRHPENQRHRYTDLNYWTELAQLLEKGKFDALFLADVVGIYDVYRQSRDTAVREAVQIPVNDPLMLISAMAYVTKHLAFAVTFSTTYEHPYGHARRMSTLDHLTKGRIAWNVVTSHLPSADKNFGIKKILEHDERYDLADEYLEVCYKLWEGSWEDNAVIRDIENNIYTDPSKVHEINHSGKYFEVPGPHLCEPSPQRTPVIYQAGMSERGREFAAKHAECVFLGGKDVETLKFFVDDIRKRAKKYGRNPDHIKMFAGICVIVGKTHDEAMEKLNSFQKYWSLEGHLAHYGGGTGYDLSKYSSNDYIGSISVGEIINNMSKLDGKWFKLSVGTPKKVADEMQYLVEEAGIDGFNLVQYVSPGTFVDFIELVVPELQKRGLYRVDYEEGTYREKLFGKGNYRLPDDHIAARYRNISSNV